MRRWRRSARTREKPLREELLSIERLEEIQKDPAEAVRNAARRAIKAIHGGAQTVE